MGEFYKVEEDPALPSPPAAAQDETAATQAATNAPPTVEAPAAAQATPAVKEASKGSSIAEQLKLTEQRFRKLSMEKPETAEGGVCKR